VAGDLDSIDQLIGVYEDPDCRLHDNKLAARWEARGDAVAERGEGEFKQSDYRVVINIELSDDGYSVSCDEGDVDLDDRLSDAFDKTGIDGYKFLDNFANEALWAEDPKAAEDLFDERMIIIKYLKDRGFMDETYDFALSDIRIV
jgi:hypothetical protein